MTEKHVFIPADLSKPVKLVEISLNEEGGLLLDDLHRVLGCDDIENVLCDDDFLLLVDGCGKIRDDPKPVNERAFLFYNGALYGDYIAGDALLGYFGERKLADGSRVSDFCPFSRRNLAKALGRLLTYFGSLSG